MSSAQDTLAGRSIAIPETRQLDVLADMLEKRGARVIRCPLVAILDAPDPKPVERWLKEFIDTPCDDLILLTGEGLRRLVGFAERAGVREAFVDALARVRTISRGPKPGRALREVGLKPNLLAEAPTTDGVIATLEHDDIGQRRIAVQLYGTDPNEKLIGYLSGQGAQVTTVAPYIYADHADEQQVLSLIEQLTAGKIDVIAFTSQPQLRRLTAVAKKNGKAEQLHQALVAIRVAAIGPVMEQTLVEAGIPVEITPERTFFMKPLVRNIERAFS
jgi:uroporphyrinogen-III synthase